MPSMPGPTNRRVPGHEPRERIMDALDLIGRAIEALDAGKRAPALRFYERAREAAAESRSESALTCLKACDLAIARIKHALTEVDAAIDLTPAMSPDLGQATVRARRAEAAHDAELESARRANVAAYNKRRYATEIRAIETALPKLRGEAPARAIGNRMLAELLDGARRGYSEQAWKLFVQGCRREGVSV